MTEFSIDTRTQSIHLRLHLRGDTEPVDVHVKKYSLEQVGDQAMLTIVEGTASREWVDAALQDFVLGRHFKIPAAAVSVLKLLT